MSRVKILVHYHKRSAIIENESIIPVTTALSNPNYAPCNKEDIDFLEQNMVYNIKDPLPFQHRLDELAATYWAYKNMEELGNPDFIGFMHYRCYFDFRYKGNEEHHKHPTIAQRIDNLYIQNYGLDNKTIGDLFAQYEAVFPIKWHSRKSVKESFQLAHRFDEEAYGVPGFFQEAMELIVKEHPKFSKVVKSFLSAKTAYYHNMFVLPRALFMDYAQWLFPLLEKLDKKLPVTEDVDMHSSRLLGFVAERMTGIYLSYLRATKPSLKIRYLPPVLAKNSKEKPKKIEPAFSQNHIPICFSFSGDQKYLSLFLVAIQSIINHSTPQNNYDIIVFITNPALEKNRHLVDDLVAGRSNIKIRFIDPLALLSAEDHMKLNEIQKGKFSKTDYMRDFGIFSVLRVSLGKFLPAFSKVIYLDIDVMLRRDIAELYHIPLDGKTCGMSSELMYWPARRDVRRFNEWCKEYKIESKDYYNCGVMLVDLEKMRENPIFSVESCAQFFIDSNPAWGDQDFLCFYLKDNIKKLDLLWNFSELEEYSTDMETYLTRKELLEYKEVAKTPGIIHFKGVISKPWHFPISYSAYTKEWREIEKNINYPRESFAASVLTTPQMVRTLKNSIRKALNKHPATKKILLFFYKIIGVVIRPVVKRFSRK